MKKKTLRIIAIIVGLSAVIVLITIVYLFNMPARDVQSTKTDFSLTSTEIVNEYLNDKNKANLKYLQEEGDSKILAITGKVQSISEDQNKQKVVLLKEETDKAGVSCTFIQKTNGSGSKLKLGQTVTIKGVIRSGAEFDKDLDMYEDVIMEKCDVIK